MTAWGSDKRPEFSPLTIDDLSSGGGKTSTAGTLILSTQSSDFYGDIVIGNTGTPTVEVMSDAALGYDGGNAELVGTVELNGGTLQTGASFSASERDINVEGGSQIDLDGNTTSWGTLTDVKRTLAIVNSSATAGAITFDNLTISQTSTLKLDGTKRRGLQRRRNGDFHQRHPTNRRLGHAHPRRFVLNRAWDDRAVFSAGASTTLVDGIAPVWIVTNEGNASGPAPMISSPMGPTAMCRKAARRRRLAGSTGASVVELAASTTTSGNLAAYALNTNGYSISLGSNTLALGDGTDDAGLILANGSAISGGTLAFGAAKRHLAKQARPYPRKSPAPTA